MRIVFSAFPKHIELIKEMSVREHIPLVFQKELEGNLAGLDIKYESLSSFIDESAQRQIIKQSSTVIASLSNTSLSGENVSQAVKEYFKDEFIPEVYNQIPILASLVIGLDNAKPDAIVLHNDVEPYNRVIALWARERSVPCFHVPHSIILETDKHGVGGDIHDVVTATRIASSGPYQTKWYKKRDLTGVYSIRETGLPQFDEVARLGKNMQSRQRAASLLGLKIGMPIVSYMSSWAQGTNILGVHNKIDVSYTRFLQSIKSIPGVQAIVKMHPHASPETHNAHIAKAEMMGVEGVTFVRDYLPIVLQASDLVFAYGPSNVIIEAAHFPHIRLACTEGYDDDEVAKIPVELDASLIAARLRELLSKDPVDYSSFLSRYCIATDGKNTERVATYIEEDV